MEDFKTKEFVLGRLFRERGRFVSGGEMSRDLQISRAAVSEAVKSLVCDGYGIRAVIGRGYALETAPEAVTRGELLAHLPPERVSLVRCLGETDSTNTRLRALALDGAPAGTVVVAETQTAGRGRMGRPFQSKAAQGLYLSYLMRPDTSPSETAMLTAWIGVAAARVIGELTGTEPGLKWVNDLVMNRRKIGGILTELSVEGESGRVESVIVGIGINVSAGVAFPPELEPVATSVGRETGVYVRLAALAAALIRRFDRVSSEFPGCREAYLEDYRRLSVTTGNRITVIRPDSAREATALSVEPDFSLRVRYDDGTEDAVTAGDVSVRGLYGYT